MWISTARAIPKSLDTHLEIGIHGNDAAVNKTTKCVSSCLTNLVAQKKLFCSCCGFRSPCDLSFMCSVVYNIFSSYDRQAWMHVRACTHTDYKSPSYIIFSHKWPVSIAVYNIHCRCNTCASLRLYSGDGPSFIVDSHVRGEWLSFKDNSLTTSAAQVTGRIG